MSFWQQYLDYVRDNPQGYWFKSKICGWGWTPVRWQGWAVTLGFIALLVLLAMSLGDSPTEQDLQWFFAKLIGLVVALLVICWRTGEPPRWQWGFPKKKDE